MAENTGTCPKCRHAEHGVHCFNMASDNDCSCTWGAVTEAMLLPDDEAREALAQLVAAITSGIKAALPEQADYDLADKFIRQIEEAY